MKLRIAFVVLALSFGISPVMGQTTPPPAGAPQPDVVLPDGPLPVGEATNLVFIAPVVGALVAVAAAVGGGTSSTTSTVSTTN